MHRAFSRIAIAAIALAVAFPATCHGQIISAGPFIGQWSESFEGSPPGFHPSLPILLGSPEGPEPNGFMIPAFITSGSTFMGSTINAHAGTFFAHSTGPVTFEFPQPIQLFGGYVATNGGASGGTVEFFDEEENLLGVADLDVTFAPGQAPYTWNGWFSSTGFSRITVTSNGTLGGFLGFDDLEASPVPAPPALLLLASAIRMAKRRRPGAD
jgi:hypothetical protein